MKRVGLFVGIDKYQDIGISQLRCAVKDATALMAAFSKAQYDHVDSLLNENAHCEKILDTAENIVRELEAGDLFVFYFSGHGREFANIHYLVGPTGRANAALYQRGSFSLPELISVTNKPGINRLFILDCCRSNILAGRSGNYVCDTARDIALDSALSEFSCEKCRDIIPPLILNSCSTGQQAFEGVTHGYFTETLLKSISRRDVMSFQDFQKSLQISGTPAPQNISWNGDLSYWEHIVLFDHWNQKHSSRSVPESGHGFNQPVWEILNEEVQKIPLRKSNRIDDSLQNISDQADHCGKKQELSSAVDSRKQAKQKINEDKKKTDPDSARKDIFEGMKKATVSPKSESVPVANRLKITPVGEGKFRISGNYWVVWKIVYDVLEKANFQITREDFAEGVIMAQQRYGINKLIAYVMFCSAGSDIELEFHMYLRDLARAKSLLLKKIRLFGQYFEEFADLNGKEYIGMIPDDRKSTLPPPRIKHEGVSYAEQAKWIYKYAYFGILTPVVSIIVLICIACIRNNMNKSGNYDGEEFLRKGTCISIITMILYGLIISILC